MIQKFIRVFSPQIYKDILDYKNGKNTDIMKTLNHKIMKQIDIHWS